MREQVQHNFSASAAPAFVAAMHGDQHDRGEPSTLYANDQITPKTYESNLWPGTFLLVRLVIGSWSTSRFEMTDCSAQHQLVRRTSR